MPVQFCSFQEYLKKKKTLTKKNGRNSNLIIESSIKHTLSLMAFMHTHSCCRACPAQMSYHREHLNGNGFGMRRRNAGWQRAPTAGRDLKPSEAKKAPFRLKTG